MLYFLMSLIRKEMCVMHKDFGVKTQVYPIPVFIAAAYDPVHHAYIQLGKAVGRSFVDRKKLNV